MANVGFAIFLFGIDGRKTPSTILKLLLYQKNFKHYHKICFGIDFVEFMKPNKINVLY